MNRSLHGSQATAMARLQVPAWPSAAGSADHAEAADVPGPVDVALTALLCIALFAAVTALGTWWLQADATDPPRTGVVQAKQGGTSRGAADMPRAFERSAPQLFVPAPPQVRSDIERFLLNFLLQPSIDDTEPLRWADWSIGLVCSGASRVLVDGRPLETGALVPAADFALRFDLSRCATLVDESMEFQGAVDMRVSRADGKLLAQVQPRPLNVLTAHGLTSLTSPFTACLAVDHDASCEHRPAVVARTTVQLR